MGCYGRRPRRTPLLTQRHKRARLQFAKMYVSKPKSFWETVLWTDETKIEFFGKARHSTIDRKRNEAYKKEHSTYSQIWWRFKDVLGLFCCLWHWAP